MAPSNWEQDFKEKLHNRQLQPSQDAWHKLQNRIDTEEKRSTKNLFWKWSIAASIASILIVSVFVFTKNDAPENTLVTTPKTEVKTDKDVIDNQKNIQIASENTISTPSEKNLKTSPQITTETVSKTTDKVNKQEAFQSYEDEKIDEVLAQVQTLVDKNKGITEQELDSLLLLAEQELKAYKLLALVENQTTTNPQMLLAEVESDLDNSFRVRVLDKLLSGYESIRDVVVSRKN